MSAIRNVIDPDALTAGTGRRPLTPVAEPTEGPLLLGELNGTAAMADCEECLLHPLRAANAVEPEECGSCGTVYGPAAPAPLFFGTLVRRDDR